MNIKKLVGWLAIILISFSPVFLLIFLGPSLIYSYSDITHKLGQITALIGITMFAITFILATRLKFIEDIFGGLDKVYVVHCIVGATALMMILFHPILLVLKFIPSNLKLAAEYLLPNAYWSVNFGIIALLGMIGLIYLTFYSKIKYHQWKISHEFLGAVFIFAVLHMFLVRGTASRDYIFSGYYLYASIVSLIGLASFFYSLFLKNRIKKQAIYKIKNIEKKKNVNEITLSPLGKPIQYKSGQFIFIRFYNEKLSNEAHPFSIASKSNNPEIKIMVKNLGDFTGNLHQLNVGDRVGIEGPYGRFNFHTNKTNPNQIWVAGGIGITPFIGMVEDLKPGQKVDLYYSVKSEDEFMSLDFLKSIEAKNKNFRLFPWITSKNGYLTLKNIQENSGKLADKEFCLCGPNALKEALKNDLIKLGISNDKIHSEEFSFR